MSRDRLIHTILFTPIAQGRWGLPCIWWGAPGVGKSAILEGAAAAYKLHCETLSPGERGEGAFGVTPVPGDGLKSITYPAPDWTDKVTKGGLVFLDEMSCAAPSLQQPMLGLLQARRIGSHQLHPRCRVMGAANPTDIATGGWDLTPAVANRLGHLDWQAPTLDEWTTWILGGAGEQKERGDAEAEEARVLKAWPSAFARASGLVTGFLRRRPDLLHKMPAAGDPGLSRGWPSHRSWENATRAIASSDVHGLSETDGEDLILAFVGKGAADEFITWRQQVDLPDPEAVLDGKVKFVFDEARLDRSLAVYASCAALVAPKDAPKRKERAAVCWKLFGEAAGSAMDIVVPAATVLVNAQLVNVAEARPLLAKLEPFLRLADVDQGRR